MQLNPDGGKALPPENDRGGRLVASGWAFFLPYAALYLVALLLGLTCGALRLVFWIGHALLVAAAAFHGVRRLRGLWRSPSSALVALAFWILLAFVFWLPGAYLEFPGDPWEHVRRLNSWHPEALLSAAPAPLR